MHTIVVPTSIEDHAEKLKKQLKTANGHGPAVNIVRCNDTFNDTYPQLCDRGTYLVRNEVRAIKRICSGIGGTNISVHVLNLDEADNLQVLCIMMIAYT